MLHWKGTASQLPAQAGGAQSHALVVPGICMSMGLRMLRDDVKPIHSLGTKTWISLPCAMSPKLIISTVLAHQFIYACVLVFLCRYRWTRVRVDMDDRDLSVL